jgi:hypothetical protein
VNEEEVRALFESFEELRSNYAEVRSDADTSQWSKLFDLAEGSGWRFVQAVTLETQRVVVNVEEGSISTTPPSFMLIFRRKDILR